MKRYIISSEKCAEKCPYFAFILWLLSAALHQFPHSRLTVPTTPEHRFSFNCKASHMYLTGTAEPAFVTSMSLSHRTLSSGSQTLAGIAHLHNKNLAFGFGAVLTDQYFKTCPMDSEHPGAGARSLLTKQNSGAILGYLL